MGAWGPLGLISVTAALLALPVTPALYELRKRVDIAALPTSRHDGRIVNFADSFYARIEPLRAELQECEAKGEIARLSAEGMNVLLVGSADFDFEPEVLNGVVAVLCSSSAVVPPNRIINADVYTEANLEIGRGAAIRAALAAGDLILGEGSTALRWLHSYGRVRLGKGSSSYGRLSALQEIRLDRGCCFQHMHAPRLLTVDSEGLQRNPVGFSEPARKATNFDVPRTQQRIRIQGDFTVPTSDTLLANLVARGELRFERGSCFVGNAKSYKDTVVEEGASVQGSIVCGGTVMLGSRCFVRGPIIAERDVIIGEGVQVGSPEALSTISCSRAIIGRGCRLHGTVWARDRGYVEE